MARFLVTLAVAMAGAWPAAPVLSATLLGTQLSYLDFLKIPPAQRDREFAALSPDNRAAIMKQHLERWLDVHRPDLSSHAQALVREAIDVVTPELYAVPPNQAAQQRQLVLARRMACALGDARASTLMKLDRPPQRISETWAERTRQWIDWFVNCAGR